MVVLTGTRHDLLPRALLNAQGSIFTPLSALSSSPLQLVQFFSIVVQKSWLIRQLDVNNEFLHEHLKKEVFIRQPPGFEHPNFPNHICKLRKAIYGQQQASRAWYKEFEMFLVKLGFTNSHSDTSLFIQHCHSFTIYFLVYVDDIIITGSNLSVVTKVIQKPSAQFSLKDLGPLNYFLGVEVQQEVDGILLSQCKYIKDLLCDTNMHNCNGISTPMTSSCALQVDVSATPIDESAYRRILGKLQYLSFTRPILVSL